MRLFLGIELPDSVKAAAAKACGRIRKQIERDAPTASIRWVPAENLHITLWFLGEVRDNAFDPLAAALTPQVRLAPFRLRLSGAGAFPESGPPRTLWLGVPEGAAALRTIYAELANRLGTLGFPPEQRPYSPHLTIARVKDVRRSDGAAVRAALTANFGDIGEYTVPWITLFRSQSTSSGSRYEHLLRVPLE